ncbi:recombinase family protein [Kyrpidia tusciae]|uniref:DNA binding domain protein, excisionase family n=1 Tax=Kyrpidia tusciae (strain DSM 2912 / NBRC 15312 / T2) TaxID=562970 RepID=D5WX13_KYRT2|nr:recombinase family protein [Kyrpidia tusciae]ADG07794.1 DNA binding domain protein, excisionase family [Kyrpidia tusciae DSM 2912]
MKVSIGKAAKELGVSPETLRRWEAEGKIRVERTPGGHRRYDLASLQGWSRKEPEPKERITLAYARVSSHDQKADLVRQVELLETFCAANGWRFEVLRDLGSGLNYNKRGYAPVLPGTWISFGWSGLNYNKRGLRELIRWICSGEVGRLVVTHKSRLLRFGSELVFSLCEHFGTEVVIINASEEATFEEELVQDVLEIITVFSARLYGSRSRSIRDIMKTLREAADAIRPENASGSG